MKKYSLFILAIFFTSNVFASIPYCQGTSVTEAKDQALQSVVTTYAEQNHCVIGDNCLLNFDEVKYSIAWAKPCIISASHHNDPNGSTFICANGICHPYGFASPSAPY